MPQKSHRVASRQAEVSRERKRKKKSRGPQVSQRNPASPPDEAALASVDGPGPAPEPISPATPPRRERPQRVALPVYQYVYADLRRIAIIAAAILVVLIVLTFVLG
ncbi:MAG: hypothetical protein SV910_04130 [Chloroflexota bacterium]|nr:hypothetical protein [Chloroflexota bacterium]